VPPDSRLQPKVLPARRGEPEVNQLFALHRCNLSDKFTFARTQLEREFPVSMRDCRGPALLS
jgi:hypothetical protein